MLPAFEKLELHVPAFVSHTESLTLIAECKRQAMVCKGSCNKLYQAEHFLRSFVTFNALQDFSIGNPNR